MRYQSQIEQLQPVSSNQGRLFQSLSQRLSAFAGQEEDRLDREMAKKAKQQGLVDAQGKRAITLRDGSTIADEAWNEGAIASHLSAVKLDIIETNARIASETPSDPDAYKAKFSAYSSGLLEALDPRMRPAVSNELSSVMLNVVLSKQADRTTDERAKHAVNIETAYDQLKEGALKKAQDGDLEGMITDLQQSMALIDTLESGKFIKPEEAKKRRDELKNDTDQAIVFSEFEHARKAGRGDEYLQKFIDKPPRELDADEARKYAAIMDKTMARDTRLRKRMEADELSELGKARAKQASDLEIGVSRGTMHEDDVERAFQNKVISAAKRTSLIKDLDKQTEKEVEYSKQIARVAASKNGGIPLSSINADDVKAVDAYYSSMIEGQDPASDEMLNSTANLVASTTIVPTQVKELAQSYSKSGNVEQAVYAADVLARINEKTPQALQTLSKDVKAFSLLVSRQVAAGMEPERAVELSRLSVYETTPEEAEAVKRKFELGTDNYRGANYDFLSDKMDDDFDTWYSYEPEIPPAMDGEFQLLVSQYLGKTRDMDMAQKLAYEDLTRVWGVTEINGERQMMKYPPEKVYGEGDWLRPQLMEDVKSTGVELGDDDKPIIVVDPLSAREEKPSYLVFINRENGYPEPLIGKDGMPLRWAPDYKTSPAGKKEQKELEKMMEEAREEMKSRTAALPERTSQMRDITGELRNVTDVR